MAGSEEQHSVLDASSVAAEARLDLSSCRIGALLNHSSGSCDAKAEHDLHAILAKAELKANEVWCGQSSDYQRALDDTSGQNLDVLIVLGGDGTIRSAAEHCGTSGPLLIPLPGGTMNVLPTALYGPLAWRDALAATLERPTRRIVSGGEVGQRRFFIAALFGGASRMGEAREALRKHEVAGAIKKGVSALGSVLESDLHYAFNGLAGSSEAIAVLCERSNLFEGPSDRLEAVAFKLASPLGAVRLALEGITGGWRTDPAVVRASTERVSLRSRGPISAMLDGETFELGSVAEIAFIPKAFAAIVPESVAT